MAPDYIFSLRLALLLLVKTTIIGLASAYKDYQQKIPNGHRVPHPCLYNTIWGGVGHENPNGAGVRNPFGLDFAANQFQWDSCLCMKDSDGDGKTNGEELGDPDCIWVEGSGELPSRIDQLTHPGVCEPIEDENCKMRNSFEVCQEIDFKCDAINQSDSSALDVRLTPYEIPSEQTSHACIVIDFDTTREMHAIAMEPIIDQSEIVHHIDLTECLDGDPGAGAYPTTTACGAMAGCTGIMLATWTLGIPGICLLPQVGIRLGKNGAQGAMLMIHYHNPFNRVGRVDSSGLRMWVTEDLRNHSAQLLQMSQWYLEIPPGQSRVEQYLECDDRCTGQWVEPVYLVFAGLHMHYLGTGGKTEIWRNGSLHRVIIDQHFFDYNSPHIQSFDPPIEVLPGDTIRHTCVFQSREQTEVTWRGSQASDEMCACVVVYYPAQSFTQCHNYGKVLACGYDDGRPRQKYWEDCDSNTFERSYRPVLIEQLKLACNETGDCPSSCKEIVEEAYANYTCLSPDYRDATFQRSSTLRNLMRACADYPTPEPLPTAPVVEMLRCDSCSISINLPLTVTAIFHVWMTRYCDV